MTRAFLTLVALLMLLTGVAVGHYWLYDRVTPLKKLEQIAALTQIGSPVLSVTYAEPRVLLYEAASNPAYPQLQPINRMDFVYDQ